MQNPEKATPYMVVTVTVSHGGGREGWLHTYWRSNETWFCRTQKMMLIINTYIHVHGYRCQWTMYMYKSPSLSVHMYMYSTCACRYMCFTYCICKVVYTMHMCVCVNTCARYKQLGHWWCWRVSIQWTGCMHMYSSTHTHEHIDECMYIYKNWQGDTEIARAGARERR